MEREDRWKFASVISHLLTIIPAFIFAWEFGVGTLLYWGIIDLVAYLILKK